MMNKCPGASLLRTPTLKHKDCPECGMEIEIFSTDKQVVCSTCGFVIYNEIASCIQHCQHAKECLGDEIYNKLLGDVEKKD